MTPSPLKNLRHKKGWRLIHVSEKLKLQGTPISWPTLINIDRGYKFVITKDGQGNPIARKIKYNPFRRTLADIARLFKVKPEDVYTDLSKD